MICVVLVSSPLIESFTFVGGYVNTSPDTVADANGELVNPFADAVIR